jgi:hypothetical protein
VGGPVTPPGRDEIDAARADLEFDRIARLDPEGRAAAEEAALARFGAWADAVRAALPEARPQPGPGPGEAGPEPEAD